MRKVGRSWRRPAPATHACTGRRLGRRPRTCAASAARCARCTGGHRHWGSLCSRLPGESARLSVCPQSHLLEQLPGQVGAAAGGGGQGQCMQGLAEPRDHAPAAGLALPPLHPLLPSPMVLHLLQAWPFRPCIFYFPAPWSCTCCRPGPSAPTSPTSQPHDHAPAAGLALPPRHPLLPGHPGHGVAVFPGRVRHADLRGDDDIGAQSDVHAGHQLLQVRRLGGGGELCQPCRCVAPGASRVGVGAGAGLVGEAWCGGPTWVGPRDGESGTQAGRCNGCSLLQACRRRRVRVPAPAATGWRCAPAARMLLPDLQGLLPLLRQLCGPERVHNLILHRQDGAAPWQLPCAH